MKIYCVNCRYFISSLGYGDYCYKINSRIDTPVAKKINTNNHLNNNKNNDCKEFIKYQGDKWLKNDKKAEKEFHEWSGAYELL